MVLQLFLHRLIWNLPGLNHLRNFLGPFLSEGKVQGSPGRRVTCQGEAGFFNCKFERVKG